MGQGSIARLTSFDVITAGLLFAIVRFVDFITQYPLNFFIVSGDIDVLQGRDATNDEIPSFATLDAFVLNLKGFVAQLYRKARHFVWSGGCCDTMRYMSGLP